MIKYCTSDFKTITENAVFSSDLKTNCSTKGIIMIPSDPSGKDITKKYGDEIIRDFDLIGITFETVKYIFDMNDIFSKDFSIHNYSVIFLMGGRTKCQNKFLKSIDFLNLISDFQGVLVGQSAGALNLCKAAFLSPDCNDVLDVEFIDGLNLVNDTFDVHFNVNNNRQKDFIREADTDMLCICDNGAIRYDENGAFYLGEVYRYSEGSFELV